MRRSRSRAAAGARIAVRSLLEGVLVGAVTVALTVLGLLVADVFVDGRAVSEVSDGAALALLYAVAVYGIWTGIVLSSFVLTVVGAVVLLRPALLRSLRTLSLLAALVVLLVMGAYLLQEPSDLVFATSVASVAAGLTAWRSAAVLRYATGVFPPAVLAGVRRGAGTRTGVDLLRQPVGFLRRFRGLPFDDPAEDIAELRRGCPVALSAFRLQTGRIRHGLLVVHQVDDDVTASWHPYRAMSGFGPADAEAMPARWPEEPTPVRWKRLPRLFRPVNLLVGEAEWLLALTRHDIPLLQAVVATARHDH